MIIIKAELIKDEIIALIPVYSEIGDGTHLITTTGQSLMDKRRIKSVKKALARVYGLDLTAQGEMVQNVISRHKRLPFYLAPDRVFVPLKMRRPATRNDSGYGYVSVSSIKTIDGTTNPTIVLNNNIRIPLISSRTTAIFNYSLGKQLYDKLNQSDYEPQAIIKNFITLILEHIKFPT